MDDRWWTVWSLASRACRAAGLPSALVAGVVLFASAALGLHAVGSSVVQVLVGAAFAVLPGFALGSLLLVGGHAASVGAARRLRLDHGRWHHQVLCLLLSALGIVLVALLANVGGGLTPYRGG